MAGLVGEAHDAAEEVVADAPLGPIGLDDADAVGERVVLHARLAAVGEGGADEQAAAVVGEARHEARVVVDGDHVAVRVALVARGAAERVDHGRDEPARVALVIRPVPERVDLREEPPLGVAFPAEDLLRRVLVLQQRARVVVAEGVHAAAAAPDHLVELAEGVAVEAPDRARGDHLDEPAVVAVDLDVQEPPRRRPVAQGLRRLRVERVVADAVAPRLEAPPVLVAELRHEAPGLLAPQQAVVLVIGEAVRVPRGVLGRDEIAARVERVAPPRFPAPLRRGVLDLEGGDAAVPVPPHAHDAAHAVDHAREPAVLVRQSDVVVMPVDDPAQQPSAAPRFREEVGQPVRAERVAPRVAGQHAARQPRRLARIELPR
ncbi:hypothetical protein [Sorangium sp. So ce1335]|uniref:hypothetical protein n=1 Tax=Sorangium sp. So ce1335 TaxID=3133335 RepID=UPI003F645E0E